MDLSCTYGIESENAVGLDGLASHDLDWVPLQAWNSGRIDPELLDDWAFVEPVSSSLPSDALYESSTDVTSTNEILAVEPWHTTSRNLLYQQPSSSNSDHRAHAPLAWNQPAVRNPLLHGREDETSFMGYWLSTDFIRSPSLLSPVEAGPSSSNSSNPSGGSSLAHLCPICHATPTRSSDLVRHLHGHGKELYNPTPSLQKQSFETVKGEVQKRWSCGYCAEFFETHDPWVHHVVVCKYRYQVTWSEVRQISGILRAFVGKSAGPDSGQPTMKDIPPTKLPLVDVRATLQILEPDQISICGLEVSLQAHNLSIAQLLHQPPYFLPLDDETGESRKRYRLRQEKGQYPCDSCDRVFARAADLSRHHVRHNRRHECADCGLAFAYPKDLRRHRMRHEAMKLHCTYPGCSGTFARSDTLKRHVRSCHSSKDD